jgi:hypothetical protein
MKFQVGDKVLILHSNEEGEVIDIMNEKMVMVEVRGVKFPAYIDQLDFPYFKRFSEKKMFPAKKEKRYVDDVKKEKHKPAARKEDGVWLTFLPVFRSDEFGDEIVEELKVHLVNHTSSAYHFDYKLLYFGKPGFELKNQVQAFEDFYLHDVAFEDMNDNPSFSFEFSLLKPDRKKAEFFESQLKLRARQLFAKIEEIRTKNEATFSYRLFENYPDKVYEEPIDTSRLASKGFKVYDAKHARRHLEPARSVVDLHIEKLTNDWKHLGNFEILSLQLATFEKYLELALAHLQPSLIVIHGVGEGKLRDEIHERLRLKKEVKSFVNQYHPLYGYGATEIFFQY